MDLVPAHMNACMPEGIHVSQCYAIETPLKRLAEIDWSITMEYDGGVPATAVTEIEALLGQEALVIQKKSKKAKKGYTEIDLIPMIHRWEMAPEENRIRVHARPDGSEPGTESIYCGGYHPRPVPRSRSGFCTLSQKRSF